MLTRAWVTSYGGDTLARHWRLILDQRTYGWQCSSVGSQDSGGTWQAKEVDRKVGYEKYVDVKLEI